MKMFRFLLALIFATGLVGSVKVAAQANPDGPATALSLETELLDALKPSITVFANLRTVLASNYWTNPDSQRTETYRQYLFDLARFGLQPNRPAECRSSLNPVQGSRPALAPRVTSDGTLSRTDACYPRLLPSNVRGPIGMEFDERPANPDGEEGRRPPVVNHGGSGTAGGSGGGAGRRNGD